jgi:hypothetical protein
MKANSINNLSNSLKMVQKFKSIPVDAMKANRQKRGTVPLTLNFSTSWR